MSRIAAVQQILAAQDDTPDLYTDKRSTAAAAASEAAAAAVQAKKYKKSNPSYDTDGIELPRPRLIYFNLL